MAQAEEGRNITTEQLLIIQRNNFSADLLPRFVSGNNFPEKTEVASEDNEEIELSLGLSLNGRFGVDPRAKNNFTLKRSSSIPDFLTTNTIRNDDVARPETPSSFAPLVRTCSLPIETEEVWRKRKELQTLKRMEAKRKRSEKQRNLKEGREKNPAFVEEKCKENKRSFSGSFQQEQYLKVMDGFSSMVIPSWNFCSKGSICHGLELNCDKPNGGLPPQPSSQGFSAGSSGISDSESQAYQATGAHKCAEIKSPASVKSMSEKEWRLPMASRTKSGELNEMAMKNKCYVNRTNSNGAKEVVRNVLEDMPSVSTTGDGPNGKRVEGFLYGYRKGEEVRILCVCHGTFLTPSEFVKHAGGGDVTNPLKHIVVSSSSFL